MNKDWLEKDFYATLGVSKDASADELKKKYRTLARENHPDKNPGDAAAESRFKDVSEAYDVLSDPAKRKEYDEARALFAGGGFPGGGFGGAGGPGGFGGGQYNVNVEDLFGDSGGGFGDFLGGLFNRGGGGRNRQPRRGQDLESELTLSFDDALDGVTVPLRLSSDAPCSICNGTGAKAGTVPRVCPTCDGTGQTSRNAGGFAFAEPCPSCRGRGRLKGKGGPGERGGPVGDLFVVVHVDDHAIFGRKGNNVTLTAPITFSEAALGSQITVPTPRGNSVTLKIPAGTSTGRVFRVRGKGIRGKDGKNGDLLVTVNVAVPQNMTDEQRDALQTYADLVAGEDPRKDLSALAGNPNG